MVGGRASHIFNKDASGHSVAACIRLIWNDDKKKTETQRAIAKKILKYSFKILYTSFHLNSQTVSGQRILPRCCFDHDLFFSSFLRSVRTAMLDTSFRCHFEPYNPSVENTYICL